MTNEIQTLQKIAANAKFEYKTGQITREQAIEQIQPYIDVANAKSREIAKKYNQRPKLITLTGYLRSAY